jgi:hypothetical protein
MRFNRGTCINNETHKRLKDRSVMKSELLQVVLASQENTEKQYFYRLLHNFLGKGLITSSGKFWEMFKLARKFWQQQ